MRKDPAQPVREDRGSAYLTEPHHRTGHLETLTRGRRLAGVAAGLALTLPLLGGSGCKSGDKAAPAAAAAPPAAAAPAAAAADPPAPGAVAAAPGAPAAPAAGQAAADPALQITPRQFNSGGG